MPKALSSTLSTATSSGAGITQRGESPLPLAYVRDELVRQKYLEGGKLYGRDSDAH